ncbi:hypothetical protein [Legionella londiniensis]|uniref:Uncharacterized protein n=1 Tax=Legionella londiniensis TaxID=45068 RepID=A0A0W0VMK6_9GAMM|nr:hypothetical protein [Legionella londiniensis]KTD21387.1 hypothetical protein Llon_1485 [Legionella londiniensis]STX93556.1 Uncharacterised protein [Legionella londiniensis]
MKKIILPICLIFSPVLSFSHNIESTQSSNKITVEVDVNFGQDLGQNFGTFFEARDVKTGKLLFGAGFPATYNTRFQNDRYQMQFFIRTQKFKKQHKLSTFPRPSNMYAQSYLYSINNNLRMAYFQHDDLVFDKKSKSWVDEQTHLRQGSNNIYTLRGKTLTFQDDKLLYDEKIILDLSESKKNDEEYKFSYYAQGHIFLSRHSKKNASLIAIPWTPYSESLPSIERAITLNTKRFSLIYSNGQLNSEVVACTNTGGIYSFKNKKWKILRNPDGNSYQVYSMITYNNRLLMGQYPSGFLLEYDGKNIITHQNWPPVPENASPSARELQTTAIYRGELFAGVWPWAELWRLDPDTNKWIAMGRLFKSPSVTMNPIHPYEQEASASGATRNQLGQRITSMIPFGDSLLMGTSWKTGENTIDKYKFSLISKSKRDEYGALHRLKMPGSIVGGFVWKDEPVKLKFVAQGNEMAIWQDGKKIASTSIDPKILKDIPEYEIYLGKGVFGKFTGQIKISNA